MIPNDLSEQLRNQVYDAFKAKQPLKITGGDSKAFYGEVCNGQRLSMTGHTGIIEYEPSELVITVRSGTSLTEVENVLAGQRQKLAFEPPHFRSTATVGGTVACGLSGPARPFLGSVRDHILGCKIINGKGEILTFGGQVIKNVAGYDVSRLMVGALGTLGVLLEVSLRVVPIPERQITLIMGAGIHESLDIMNARAAKPLPLIGASYDGDFVAMRLAGTEGSIKAARTKIAGDELENDVHYWLQLREHTHFFFEENAPLWRLSLAPATLPIGVPGHWLFDWCGGVRWLKSYEPAQHIRDAVETEGGHATLFRDNSKIESAQDNQCIPTFHPLAAPLMKYHQQLKSAFDPMGILNRHRLYRDL